MSDSVKANGYYTISLKVTLSTTIHDVVYKII